MKFQTLSTLDAKDSILAHSLALPDGRLRKGTVLQSADLAKLIKADITRVTVATLGQGDIEENQAAHRLGTALMDGTVGLRGTKAATGRVNLIANRAGVAVLDVPKLTELNAINPMISFACVPDYHQMHSGGMLGTVKIISYAVPDRDLAKACALAKDAVHLAQPRAHSVSLIITQIAKGADESKAIDATKRRLDALDSPLIEVLTCAHQTSELITTLNTAKGDVILILTASATSDPADVAPAALVQSGGTLTRFGMPVDPGNLLFLGDLAGKPVIGLPGCARSPALNGADKVLSRVLCGVPVTSADIAGMGVGGLLKEIPTRPRPRRL